MCVVSFIGLIWLTQFSFNVKVISINIPLEGIAITDSNLTMSKVAVVTLYGFKS